MKPGGYGGSHFSIDIIESRVVVWFVYAEEAALKTELDACRRANAETHRSWKVINPGKLNHVGKPVGYKLHADHCVTLYLAKDGPSGIRSSFARNHLWVTPFREDERYPGGEFVCKMIEWLKTFVSERDAADSTPAAGGCPPRRSCRRATR